MLEKQKTPQEITAYKEFRSGFEDFTRFVGDSELREQQKAAFIGDLEYIPTYDYATLQFTLDDESIRQKKTGIQEAIMELQAAKESPNQNAAVLELYIQAHERRLKKIFLVEAARDLMRAPNSAAEETLRRTFMDMNVALYGELDQGMYNSFMMSEADRLATFVPKNRQALLVASQLATVYEQMSFEGVEHFEPFTDEEARIFQQTIRERNQSALDVLPAGTEIDYSAEQSVAFMNDALRAQGLFEKGVEAVIDSATKKPSTRTREGVTKIILPRGYHATANKLRRTFFHESRHVQQGLAGESSGLAILASGTAGHFDVEEGRAVLDGAATQEVFGNDSFEASRYGYIAIGLALGPDGRPNDARETYEILWRMMAISGSQSGLLYDEDILATKEKAYAEIENIFRGTKFYQKGIIYMRKKMYVDGLMKNVHYIKKAIKNGTLNQALDHAEIGRFDYTDPQEDELVRQMITNVTPKEQS